jgi:hypothetical protein
MAAIPLRVQLLHELLERQLLVGVGLDADGADALQQLPHRRIAGQARPHHEGVDEEADHRLGLHPCPSRDGGADQDVLLPAVPGEEHLPGRQQSHEQGDAVLPPQGLERFGERPGERHRVRGDRPVLDGRAGTVERQVQHGGRPGQLGLPEATGARHPL